MSDFGEATHGARPSAPARRPQAGADSKANAPSAPVAAGEGLSNLRRRRDALAEQVTELHWDLGGLTYEMAIRDHFRLDLLVRRAAVLQERDAELAEVERLLRMEEGGVAGSCPRCDAPHSRGAVFCWQCGTTLMERLPSSAIAEQDRSTAVTDTPATGDSTAVMDTPATGDSTAVMNALLAPRAGHYSPPASGSAE
jgi:hypothetical protein